MEDRFEVIKKAVEARNQFLAENPEMQAFQDEIEDRLKKAGNSNNRQVILREMMLERVHAIGELWESLL
jgi:hypothetical protein